MMTNTPRRKTAASTTGSARASGRQSLASLLLLLLVVCTSRTNAQDAPKYAKARASIIPAQVKPGTQATLQLTLELADDAHVNSNAPRDPNLIPTLFTPQPTAGIVWGTPQYPAPTEVNEWYAKDPLPVYQNGAVIAVPFTVAARASGTLTLGGTLLAQTCDHEQCYPPRKVQISVALKLGEQPGGTQAPATSSQAAAPSEKSAPKTAAKEFSFNDLQGRPHKLSDFRGKVVLLDFWATWCKPCLADFPQLKDLYTRYRASGFEIIGLDCETLGDDAPDAETILTGAKQAKAVVARLGATWTMAETKSAVPIATKHFQVESLPTKVLLDRQGQIIQKIANGAELERLLEQLLKP
jgi:thiol-disulfide isomerase/thioredoxin